MSNWIPVSERMPTREDGDEYGNVLWKSPDGITYAMKFSHSGGDSAVAWMPIPPYTPPKPGPTDEEIRMLFSIFARRNSWAFKDIRRWFADVTAQIEREKEKGK